MSDENDFMPTEERVKALNNLRGDFSKEELLKTLMLNPYKTNSLLDALDAIARAYDPYDFGLPYSESQRALLREAVLKWLLEVI